jgi:hypothetical protein
LCKLLSAHGFTSGVVLATAGAIAVTPVAPVQHFDVPEVPAVQLSATIGDILIFTAFRQYILNQIDDIVTLAVGLGESGVALGQAIGAIPETLVQAIGLALDGNLVGALDVIRAAVGTAVRTVAGSTLNAIIERRQRYLAVQSELEEAVPAAVIAFGTEASAALSGVVDAFILATQGIVDSLLPLDLGNIVDAVVTGPVW